MFWESLLRPDIIKMETNIIICGDAIEELKKIPDESIDLVLTDPPYNIGDKNKRTKQGNDIVSNFDAWGERDNYDKFSYDLLIFNVIEQIYRVLKFGGAFYMFSAREDNGYFIRKAREKGFIYNNQLAIIKENPLPHFNKNNYRSAFELCFYMSKGKPKTFNFLSQRECINVYPYLIGKNLTEHPTEKPLGFFNKIIKISSNEGDLILDPFLGSGTTAVACIQTNRKFIGIEKSQNYVNNANNRIIPYLKQTKLNLTL